MIIFVSHSVYTFVAVVTIHTNQLAVNLLLADMRSELLLVLILIHVLYGPSYP
jgi:hypothetical protein